MRACLDKQQLKNNFILYKMLTKFQQIFEKSYCNSVKNNLIFLLFLYKKF